LRYVSLCMGETLRSCSLLLFGRVASKWSTVNTVTFWGVHAIVSLIKTVKYWDCQHQSNVKNHLYCLQSYRRAFFCVGMVPQYHWILLYFNFSKAYARTTAAGAFHIWDRLVWWRCPLYGYYVLSSLLIDTKWSTTQIIYIFDCRWAFNRGLWGITQWRQLWDIIREGWNRDCSRHVQEFKLCIRAFRLCATIGTGSQNGKCSRCVQKAANRKKSIAGNSKNRMNLKWISSVCLRLLRNTTSK
jgi:hypothetical protein